MQRYELMYICDPSNEEGIEDVKKRIEGIITGREGSVVSFEKLGKKRLAYPIEKRQFGVYNLINLIGDGRIIQALEYFMRLNPIVIRHLVLKFSEKQLNLRDLTTKIQAEEAERMRRGGRPAGSPDEESVTVAKKPEDKLKVDESVEAKLPDKASVAVQAADPKQTEAEAEGKNAIDKPDEEAETATKDVVETNEKLVE